MSSGAGAVTAMEVSMSEIYQSELGAQQLPPQDSACYGDGDLKDDCEKEDSGELKPILIQLPRSVPLGIDIDMVVPIVSYIQPYYHFEITIQ
jgi:hypothetical protein